LKKQQFNLRFQLSQGQLANTALLRTVRRNVARVQTILTQKKSGVDVKGAPKKTATKKATAKKSVAKKDTKKTTKAKSSKDDKAA